MSATDHDKTIDAATEDADALYMRAADLAYPAYLAHDGRTSAEIPDADVVAVAFLRDAIERAESPAKPTHQKCGWCVTAAGDTEEAWMAATVYTLDEGRAHALTCKHSPLVAGATESTLGEMTAAARGAKEAVKTAWFSAWEQEESPGQRAIAKHIAIACPDAVLALIARVRAAESRLRAIDEHRDELGDLLADAEERLAEVINAGADPAAWEADVAALQAVLGKEVTSG